MNIDLLSCPLFLYFCQDINDSLLQYWYQLGKARRYTHATDVPRGFLIYREELGDGM